MSRTKIDQKTHQQHDLDWFSIHGKSPNCKEVLNMTRVNALKQNFILRDSIQGGSYKIIYGYHMGKNLEARMWYYSGSEASWRAFTGYRDNFSAWMKGAEHSVNYIKTGYIFECMVCEDLELELENFYNNDPQGLEANDNIPWGLADPNNETFTDSGNYKHFLKFKKLPSNAELALLQYYIYGTIYKVNPPQDRTECLIADQYAKEIEYTGLTFPNILNAEAEKAIKNCIGSVEMQIEYISTKTSTGTKEERKGTAHKIKHEKDLWSWLTPDFTKGYVYQAKRQHPVLAEDYLIDRYKIEGYQKNTAENFFIEIAYTVAPVKHTYESTTMAKDVVTPVCWIRNVFLENSPITSFGTYKKCPINLAFLVQKPCDYAEQTSFYLAEKTGVKTGKQTSRGVEVATFTDKTHYTQDGVYSKKYIRLSLYNEAISPIIKSFKDYKKFPRFSNKYTLKLDHPLATRLLKESILKGIQEYEDIRTGKNPKGYQIKGNHGDSGLNRAAQLKIVINSCNTSGDVSKALHNCFCDNKIGSFSGGLFNGINSNPTSLFTCVCRYLVALLLDQAPANSPNDWNKRAKKPDQKGADLTLHRLDYFVSTLKVDTDMPLDQYITIIAPKLLKQI